MHVRMFESATKNHSNNYWCSVCYLQWNCHV